MTERNPASFRDDAGFIFEREGTLFRQVNRSYEADFQALTATHFLDKLITDGLLIPHRQVDVPPAEPEIAHVVLKPECIPFISHPYEWSFSQLRDAAIATLRMQRLAIDAGFTLKDASAYNIQFRAGRPVLIDTLSFERIVEGRPWAAYGQFCRHFLAPLALMAYRDNGLVRMLALHLDGVPLALASRLVPWRTRFRPGLLVHLHLHGRMEHGRAGTTSAAGGGSGFSKPAMQGLVESLEGTIGGLRSGVKGEWSDYYDEFSYTKNAFAAKQAAVKAFLAEVRPGTVCDLGSNVGIFSRMASSAGAFTVSVDGDPACVERNYLEMKRNKESSLHPLLLDLCAPSAGIGWLNTERASFLARSRFDAVLALALVHHLSITGGVPLAGVVQMLAAVGPRVMVEFVPTDDRQVVEMTRVRGGAPPRYSLPAWEAAVAAHFSEVKRVPIAESGRVLYALGGRRA